ncbi:MAG: hypothetical protein KKF30_18900 [Proteobacteria bacterium]|nr:hypothetical protein [Pseudomonadota bacterium]MBU4469397.1 hypothetical protein [Pseudomonadota bacterium]MCG2751851.1 hypothetical protein [Desulfobacteraceae bacterium]
MIRIKNIVLPFDHEPDALEREIPARLKINKSHLKGFSIFRKSLDARKKSQIKTVYTIDAEIQDEERWLSENQEDPNIGPSPDMVYHEPKPGSVPGLSPVIIGTGPCGLFAGLILAEAGLKPLLIERGKRVDERVRDVRQFWESGTLLPESNVCFGEGGAGTFSDGKLTTQIKDRSNRIRKVLAELVDCGADPEILYQAKAHIGTDHLIRIIQQIRDKILSLGGQVRFETRLTGLDIHQGRIIGIRVNDEEVVLANTAVLALGHSARDTYKMLHASGVSMEAKPFSLGVRIEHPQTLINQTQYGASHSHPRLGPAEYKLVSRCPNGRAVYSFCMCPGGKVIASSSEPGGVVTNGMSMHARHFKNGNSALLVNVDVADFGNSHPLSGVVFQKQWEAKAFVMGGSNYFAPVQRVGDFLAGKPSLSFGEVVPSYSPGVTPCDLRECLPGFVAEALAHAIPKMDQSLKGFAMADGLMTAVESRSSSPVRILRTDNFESQSIKGVYPAGEGAGYAGGIVSSAVDGIRVAEAILAKLNG